MTGRGVSFDESGRPDWRRVKTLFQSASELPPDARDAFLSEACGDDLALREEVARLLAADWGKDSVLDGAAVRQLDELRSSAQWDEATELQGKKLAHYAIGEKLGEGGMGKVFEARDTKLGRDVALKVLPPEFDFGHRLRRFRQEARALAALNHPGIVQVYAIEETDDLHFITMELVRGKPLGEVIPEGGLDPDKFLALALPLVEAVVAAHNAGVIHRDLKPDNVMVQPDGTVKVLDFGLAKMQPSLSDSAQEPSTAALATGPVAGTLPYMSPEQLLSRPADVRSDIFALGAVFYRMLSGRLPFDAESSPELIAQILDCDPEPLAGEGLTAVGKIIHRCLRRDPEERFPDAMMLLEALRAARRGELEPLGSELSDLRWPLAVTGLLWAIANIPLFIVLAAHYPQWDVVLISILQTKPSQYLFLVALFPFFVFFAELGMSDLLDWRDRERQKKKSGARPRLMESRRAMLVAGLVFGLVLALASAKALHGLDFLQPRTARAALTASRTIVEAAREESPADLMDRFRQEGAVLDPEAATALDDPTPLATLREAGLGIRRLAASDGELGQSLEDRARQSDADTLASSVFGALVFTQFALSERLNLDGMGPYQRALWWTNLTTVMVGVYVGVVLLFATTTLMAVRAEQPSGAGLPQRLDAVPSSLAFAGVVLSVWPGLRIYTLLETDLIYPEGAGPDLWIPFTIYLFCFTQVVPSLLVAPRENPALKTILCLILALSGFLAFGGQTVFFSIRGYLGAGSSVADTSVSLVTIVGFLGSVAYWILNIRSTSMQKSVRS